MKRTITLMAVCGALAQAGAYKLPEQSLNSMALGAAYVAHTTEADTAYFNPAAMAFFKEGRHLDVAATWVHLGTIDYTAPVPMMSGSSKDENIAVGALHYVAPSIGSWRWGVSVTVPGGLSKRWDTPFQKLYAEEFTLKNIEINPVVSYRINDALSIGGGVRVVYSEGIVKSDGGAIKPARRHMKGDTVEWGYNVALYYRPAPSWEMAVTYRSNINLKEEGKANLWLGRVGNQYDADVTVPLPAALNVAVAKTFANHVTLEAVYERTFWSKYKTLDFNYATLAPEVFDAPIPKNWNDTDTFRVGLTWVSGAWTWMAGVAIDETPVPDKTIGFELPDSDATVYSAGVRYRYDEHLSLGAAVLYDDKKARTIAPGVADNEIIAYGGRFNNDGALLVTLGMSYAF